MTHGYSAPSAEISIHTPIKGVTPTLTGCHGRLAYFNPHSHKGSDYKNFNQKVLKVISIHTPIKGVTLSANIILIIRLISIHTPIKGVTVSVRNVEK